ncbi:hypothetical protein FACS1894113_3230 [Alphaproteobacteria bacterium]|nr:hypothetical protein FACS1894113_3230 [Alphaproteobacteria bacterium]
MTKTNVKRQQIPNGFLAVVLNPGRCCSDTFNVVCSYALQFCLSGAWPSNVNSWTFNADPWARLYWDALHWCLKDDNNSGWLADISSLQFTNKSLFFASLAKFLGYSERNLSGICWWALRIADGGPLSFALV